MRTLLMLIQLVGLLLVSDALDSNEVLITRRPNAPIFFLLRSPNFHERGMTTQRRVTNKQQVANQMIPMTRPRTPLSRTQPTSFPSRTTITTQSNTHNSHQQGSQNPGASVHNQSTTMIIQDNQFSSHNLPPRTSIPSQNHRTTTLANHAPHTSTSSTLTTKTSRPAGSIGGQNPATFNTNPRPNPSVIDQSHRPQSFDQGPRTSIPTLIPSLVQDNKDSVTSQASKPSNIGQGQIPLGTDEGSLHSGFRKDSKPTLFDPQAALRNPVCYSQLDYGTCRAALPRYYFDPETGTCDCFLYGGCSEDGKDEGPGSFLSLEECQRVCRPPKHEEGPICKEIFQEDPFDSFFHVETTTQPQRAWVDLSHYSDEEFLKVFRV